MDLPLAAILLFILMALLAEVAGTIGGFGSSVFFVPLAGFFYDFQTVLAITGILHVFSNITKIYLFRKSINYSLLLWLGVPSVIMVIVGAFLVTVWNLKYTELVLGIFLIVFSIYFLFYPNFKLPQNKLTQVSAGGVAGFLAGLIGTGGAIRGLSLAAFNLTKDTFIATSAAIDFGVDLSRTIIYLEKGFMERSLYVFIPILFGVAVIGSYLGKVILTKVSENNFKKIVLVLLLIIGITQIVKGIRL